MSMENRFCKVELMMNSIIVTVILLIAAIFFWPSSSNTQSNPIDKTKTQIKVIVKRINIRKEPTIYSDDIGDVYEGEIYTVLEHIDDSDYYWYKITTNNGITGYIASDPNGEYVEIISGVIDRIPPVITCNKDFLLFYNGEINYDDVECVDNYSNCYLSYDDANSKHIKFIAKDDDDNESFLYVKYYKVYNFYNSYFESNNFINASFERLNYEKETVIKTKYQLKKDIPSYSKSTNYVPIITFFDENFNEINLITTKYNVDSLDNDCINNVDMTLKENYINSDLVSGSYLCINYYFDNTDSRIKYFAVGFQGVENYNKDNNYFANYYSKYYVN